MRPLIILSILACSAPSLFAAAPTSGLVAHWRFDEGSGTAANDSVGGNTGTLINSPVWVKGQVNQAINFRTNVGHHMKVMSPALSDMNAMTLSAWVFPRLTLVSGAAVLGRIWSKGENPSTPARFGLTIGADQTSLVFDAGYTTTAGLWKTPAGSFTLRIWHHVVVTYTHGDPLRAPSIYIDGIPQTVQAVSTPAGTAIPDDPALYMGSRGIDRTADFDGTLDEARVYDRELSPAEVSDLYHADLPILVEAVGPPEIVFDWSQQRCEVDDSPDAPARVFRDSAGRVNLLATHMQNYRSLGSSLDTAKRDCNKIMASAQDPVLANAKYSEWLTAPYSLDGNTVYSLVHAEWYPRLAGFGCPNWWDDGTVTALTLAISNDAGASYTHPTDYKVWQSPVAWAPSFPCTSDYGGWNPSNIVKKGDHYYSLFLVVNDPAGVITGGGPYLMRTADLSVGSSWEIWTGTGWDSSLGAKGAKIDAMGVPESLTYNTYLGAYLMVANLWDAAGKATGVYYILSQDLITWTRPIPLLVGPQYAYYPSLIDANDPSMNFELSGQEGYVYYSTLETIDPVLFIWDRDLVRQKIRFQKNSTYVMPPPPPAPTLTLTVTPANAAPGSPVTLQWSSQDTVPACTASGAWSGVKTLAGAEVVSAGAASVYTLRCLGPGGAVTRSVTINANAPDEVATNRWVNEMRVRPNPWRASLHGSTPVVFDQLGDNCTIKIFTIDGKLVQTLQASSNSASWNRQSSGGGAVAAGIYLYLITDKHGNKARGRLVLIK